MARAGTIQVKVELTPTGKALLRLAKIIGASDEVMLPDDVKQAALDVLALVEEQRP